MISSIVREGAAIAPDGLHPLHAVQRARPGRAQRIRTRKLDAFLDEAERWGIPRGRLLRQADVPPQLLASATIDHTRCARLLDVIARAVPDDYAITMGLRWDVTGYGLSGYALLSSKRFGKFVDRWPRHHEWLGHPLNFTSRVVRAEWDIFMDPAMPLSPAAMRMVVEETTASNYPAWEKFTSSPCCPLRLEVVDAPLPRDAMLADALRIEVRPNAARTSLVRRRADYNKLISVEDEALLAMCNTHCTELLSGIDHHDPVLAEIRNALLTSCGQPPRLGTMAGRLGMSERSLNRYLERSGHSYRELVNVYRRDYTFALLRANKLCVKDLAYTVGFAGPESLHRSFHKWTGLSIGEWSRRECGALPPRT